MSQVCCVDHPYTGWHQVYEASSLGEIKLPCCEPVDGVVDGGAEGKALLETALEA